jgi:hypothetical protein
MLERTFINFLAQNLNRYNILNQIMNTIYKINNAVQALLYEAYLSLQGNICSLR